MSNNATTLQNQNIVFIGSGAMAEAIIKGLLSQEIATASRITASDPISERRDYLQNEYGIETTDNNLEAVQNANIIVMSIKPQVLGKVAAGLKGKVPADALVISIIAGASLDTLQETLGHDRVVRTMPNTPAQINMGVTVWMPTAAVDDEQRVQTETLLSALGEQIVVEKEAYIDMQTGLGGSGPGFVFLIIEAMIDAGVHMGFSRADAQKITLQTIAGSVALVQATGEHPAELRNKVTSPGGTTAAGIHALEKGGLRSVLSDAIFAAYRRSQELG